MVTNRVKKPAAEKSSPRRWGGSQNAAPDEGRAKIVLAARACYAGKSIDKTTMADIAARAKVARATLYRYFPSREAVLLAVFHEEARDFLEQFRSQVGEADTFCEFLLDYLVFTLKQAPKTPLHHVLFSEQAALWVSRNYLDDPESLKLTVDFFRESFRVALRVGEIRADLELEEIVAFMARLLLSMILMPAHQQWTEAQIRSHLEKLFIRALRAPALK